MLSERSPTWRRVYGTTGSLHSGRLASVPELAVKLSRGCGNPVSFADLRAGEVVVDLGCSAGLDVIFAARRIAPGGKVVGVDFAQR